MATARKTRLTRTLAVLLRPRPDVDGQRITRITAATTAVLALLATFAITGCTGQPNDSTEASTTASATTTILTHSTVAGPTWPVAPPVNVPAASYGFFVDPGPQLAIGFVTVEKMVYISLDSSGSSMLILAELTATAPGASSRLPRDPAWLLTGDIATGGKVEALNTDTYMISPTDVTLNDTQSFSALIAQMRRWWAA